MSEATTNPGGQPSLVRHFSIEGLHGYRNLSLDSEFAATIVIARNGSGKTTLLGALDAFLQAQFSRFASLKFSRIVCRLRDVDGDLILTRQDVDELMRLPDHNEFKSIAKAYEVDASALMEFMVEEYPNSSIHDLYDRPVFNKLYVKQGYSIEKARAVCSYLQDQLKGHAPGLESLRARIRGALAEYEVVYLPTFRRVELSLPEPDNARTGRRKLSLLSRLGLPRRGLFAGDMQFGLADISERLASLNQEMLFESHHGYEEISANIIDDLITGTFEQIDPNLDDRPSEEALRLFFSRMKDGSRGRFEPGRRIQIPDLERIYSGDVNQSSRRFLNYFLAKLNTVMAKTQGVEKLVEEFITNCNRYLSETGDDSSDPEVDDSKFLNLDRRTLKVKVFNTRTKRRIPLDALSSGEKQMISLFARLYLYPGKKKVVLIDEPELSLSLGWQKKILVDILRAESCAQVVAITHSPFVFDNELDPYATMLRLRLDLSAATPDESGEADD